MDGTPIVVMPDGAGNHRPALLGRRGLLLAALGLAATGTVAGLVRFLGLSESCTNLEAGLYTVPPEQVPKPGDAPRFFAAGSFYLVNLRAGEGGWESMPAATRAGLLGLNDKCTHMQCHLPWKPEFRFEGADGWFRCPCHGTTYTKAGQRVFGPGPRSMDTVPLRRNADGSITVRFTPVVLGGPDDPQRVLPPV